MNKKTYLVTGCAGFIGYYFSTKLLNEGNCVIGIDNLNDYYDINLKKTRLENLNEYASFSFTKGDIADPLILEKIFSQNEINVVVNLAAQAGVRYSITNPSTYINSNIVGFFNILEACRHTEDNFGYRIEHLVYASSSSVYGSNKKIPYATEDKVDNPVSLYAATKKSNELMAHSYSKLYDLPTTGLRFFTVYGPMGRPDMAYFSFTNKMVNGEKIQLFNNGDMYRDFTYIDDIVEGIYNVSQKVPIKNEEDVRYKVYNIGNNKPESLLNFVEILETKLQKYEVINKPAEKEFLPMQPGDVYQTYADVEDLIKDFDFKPETSLADGLDEFAKWYKKYYL